MGNSERKKGVSSSIKMVTPWLALVIAVISFAKPATSSEPRVVCYYTNWSVYRPGTARFNPQNINPYLCTHLIYAFGGFTKENTLKPFDKYQDIEKGGYAKFTGLKTYNKNLKTMLAIGGWNEGSTRFSPMVASKERRKEFVKNAIKFLRQNRFDGLDLDWEYPAFRDGGKPKDRDNYAKLVRELREEFERESEKTNKPRLLLTMAVPAGIEYIQKGFDVKTLNQYLDWMNLLTYDYHSAFEPAVNHHAPLYPIEEPNEYSVDNELNIDYTIKFYIENGADPDKLVLGIPTYGRSYTLFNPDATEIGAPADGPGEQGDATREKGYLAYYEICEALKSKPKKRSTNSEEDEEDEDEEEQPWTVMQPNPKAMGPVAFRGNQWVGYDDIDIVKKKAEYVAENGLGGIMFWSIDNDDFRGTCHSKPYPLIESAKEAYINRLGSTDNVVVTERAKAATSAGRRRNRPRLTTTTAKPTTKGQSNKRKSAQVTSSTPAWNIVTPEPPTTPDPGSDFKCKDEGFFPHPRDCKKYFWCLDSGPSNLGIVAHHFTCPSGLFFNKAADSCDFARNVLCKKPSASTKAPAEPPTTEAATTTRRPVKLTTKNSLLFRTTTTTTTTTTPEPEIEIEYEDEVSDAADVDAEDPKVIKELIDLIKKLGGVEQLEKHLHLSGSTPSASTDGLTTLAPAINKKLYQKVLERTRGTNKFTNAIGEPGPQYSRRGPQNAGIEPTPDDQKLIRKDRPQYTTINRSRGTTSTTAEPEEEVEEDIDDEDDSLPPVESNRARAAPPSTATSARPLQYVNIRRARPTTTDTADDTASRNALFERVEPYVAVSESNSLDIAGARRENTPEYVTIRRQRPTTEESTTLQYQNTEPEEQFETLLEREISSPPVQPQYKSIVRSRPTTLPPIEEPESPEPTTVLAVQISSLLNSPSSEDTPTISAIETEPTTEAEVTTTTTTTTTTAAPTTALPRRPALRRRGSTTSTTTTSTPTASTTQVQKRTNFLRRTKATAPPDSAAPVTQPSQEKYSRRGISKFRTRNTTDTVEKRGEDVKNDTRAPSANAKRSERPTRNYVRRRLGGANATQTASTSSTQAPVTTLSSSTTRRPFRVASRRRPVTPNSSTTTTAASTTSTTTTEATTTEASEEFTQDVEERESIEDPSLKPRVVLQKKTVKIQRRPLTSLRETQIDQNPSATNEEKKGQTKEPPTKEDDRKRQSKKYSSSFKQNQLDEVLRQKSKSEEEFDSTTIGSTIADYSAETAVAIATHQLLSAPLPATPDYEDEGKTTKKAPSTQNYQYTSSVYQDYTGTEDLQTPTRNYYTSTPGPFTTTVLRASSLPNQPFGYSTVIPVSDYTSRSPQTYSSTGFSRTPAYSSTPAFSRPSGFTASSFLNGVSINPSLGPSTARYLESNNKFIAVPVAGLAYPAPPGREGEPDYFTREYLLESPVTRTYDDEYQYLSPVTTESTTTRKIPKKTVYRKISTTLRPTTPVAPSTAASRRVPQKKPFEKIPKAEPGRTYRPIENYDYYDDSDEKVVGKYQDGTKVIVHGKGSIECLDIGNFPHPSSCKKFISCAKMENGAIIGWEYVCPAGLSFDPVGGICNWSAGLGCDDK